MAQGRWFFRVIERGNGVWTCRRGRHDLDHHDSLQEALEHMTSVAVQHRPSEVVVHYLHGGVESAAILP